MAKNNKNNGKSKKTSIGGMIWKGVKEAAGPLVFVEQLTHKDRETMGDAFNSAPLMQKGKILVNLILGRISGINPFPDEVQAPATINFSGIFNRWSGLGIGMIIYGAIDDSIKINGKTILPHGSKIKQLSSRVLTGGIFGGIFDAPGDKPAKSGQTGTKHIQLIGTQSTNLSTQTRRIDSSGQRQLIAPLTVPDSAMESFD